MNGITHKQAKRYILADLDGLLSESQRRDLETHLRDCEACRVESRSFSTLTSRLQSEFHSRWDAQDGPSKKVITNVQSKTRRIIMSNRINLGLKALGGFAALVVLGFAISFVVPQLQKNSIAANETQTSLPAPQVTGNLIAFVAMDETGNREIFTMKSDGSDLTNLTNNPATDESPAWSPDGAQIAFVSDRDGGRDIYLMDADGNNVRKLTDSSTFNDHFTWSPDGKRIAYLSGKDSLFDVNQIMVVNADGSNKIALTSESGKYNFLSWSPDGQYIVFQDSYSGQNKDTRVVVVNVNGTTVSDGPFFEGDTGRLHQQVYWETPNQFVTISSNFEQTPWGKWNITRFFTAGDNTLYNGSNPILITSETPILAIFENTFVILQQDSLVWMAYQGAPIPYLPWKFSELCILPNDSDQQETSHFISPDKRHSFFSLACRVGKEPASYFLLNEDGTEIHRLGMPIANANSLPGDVSWSTDGKRVIATIATPQGMDFYRFDIETMLNDPSTNPIRLTTNGGLKYGAAWQPTLPKVIDEVKPTPEPYSFTLTVAEAETLAGFDVLEPSHLPAGYIFEGAFYDPETQKVALKFVLQNGDNGTLYIYQERGEMTSDPAVSAYVTPVAVGDAEGQYIQGVWEYASPNTTTPTWNPRADSYSLAWQRDGFALYIHFLGGETIPPIPLSELIAIAESLK